MKMNILKNGFQALIIMSLMVACSLGDVLEPSDGVSMALMETVDTVVALPFQVHSVDQRDYFTSH